MNISRKCAILTFDYEVFLGINTGSLENSVIEPTKRILEVLKNNKAKAIFFVDATWLLFLNDKMPADFGIVAKQLKSICEAGSSIELHLHPQWIQAYLDGQRIRFRSFEYYRLQSLSQDFIIDLFERSIVLLESIADIRIKCFRAGGFCIEPFDKIKPAFEKFKIKYDFSVAPGMHLINGKEYDFNFKSISNITYYRFSQDLKKPEHNGLFIEVPISTYLNNPFYRLANTLLLEFKKDIIYGDGKGIQEKSNFFIASLSRRLSISKALLTLDKTSYEFFRFLVTHHFKKSQLLVIISHPKTFSNQALLNLNYIVRQYKTLNSSDLDNYFK